MKNRSILFTILLGLALFSAACATNEPGEVTSLPTVSINEGTATEAAAEVVTTPTGAADGSTPAPEAGEPDMTSTFSVESATPAQGEGATAGTPEMGAGVAGVPDDLDEVLRVLRATGATLELGDAVEQADLSVPGQILRINGEEVQIFSYDSAEALEAQASQLAEDGNPEDEPHYYKLGTMLVRYIGSDPGVRDLLEDVLGAQAAGQ